MIYLIYDHTTGEIVDKTNNPKKAEELCQYWEDLSAYLYGSLHPHVYELSSTAS